MAVHRRSCTRARLSLAFRQGLSEAGFVEGRNVAIDFRLAEGQYDPIVRFWRPNSVRRRVDVTVASGSHPPRGAGGQGGDGDDPDCLRGGQRSRSRLDLSRASARPGGNVTGVTFLNTESALVEATGAAARAWCPTPQPIAALRVNPTSPEIAELSAE